MRTARGGLGPSQRYLTAPFRDQVYYGPIASGEVGVAALTNLYGYTFIPLVLRELRGSALRECVRYHGPEEFRGRPIGSIPSQLNGGAPICR